MLYSFDNKKPKIGKETYISESAMLIGDVRVGNNCYIGHGAILRGDYGTIEISDGCAVEEGVLIHVSEEGTSNPRARWDTTGYENWALAKVG